jgi:hypothetical protein
MFAGLTKLFGLLENFLFKLYFYYLNTTLGHGAQLIANVYNLLQPKFAQTF